MDTPNGVQAAREAGAKCIAVTNSTGAKNLKEADLICDSLDEMDLQKIIELVEKKISFYLYGFGQVYNFS